MLKINGLSYRYGRRAPPVLEDVSLELESGKVGILLGKNGSGKTTLFRCVLGLLSPQSGQILFEGKDISEMSRAKRAELAAYVPQNIQFGSLSVFDTVLAARCSRFRVRAEQRDIDKVREVLADMGISELSHKNAEELSGGERQKTAIARAAAQEPRLLILDEPTGNLDIAARQLTVREARRMAAEKNTAVLSSLHDLNEAMDLGDRFFLLKDGKIKYSGGKEVFTPEVLKDIFGIEVRVAEIDGQKIIITGGVFSK